MPERTNRIPVLNRYSPRLLYRIRQALARHPIKLAAQSLLHRLRFGLLGYPEPGRLPASIGLETVTRCNSDCAFCPVNVHRDPRPLQHMPEALVRRLAAELGAADYAGSIDLFVNNEPLVDRRIEDFCRILREAAPKAEICLFSNGRLLTPQRYFALFEAGLSLLCINNYDDALELTPEVQALVAAVEGAGHPRAAEFAGRTFIRLRLKNEVLFNRIGRAPNKAVAADYRFFRRNGCFRPFEQMVIRPTGAVGMCCNDVLGEATLGDVSAASIAAVWNGPAFAELRQALARHGRGTLPLCRQCDADVSLLTNADRHYLAGLMLRVMKLRGSARRRPQAAPPGR